MLSNEVNLPFFEKPRPQSLLCTHCGQTAEIRLTFLTEFPQQGENLCLPCGEDILRNLQRQASIADEHEHGIIYWEGHGWSSDGPFAGA